MLRLVFVMSNCVWTRTDLYYCDKIVKSRVAGRVWNSGFIHQLNLNIFIIVFIELRDVRMCDGRSRLWMSVYH